LLQNFIDSKACFELITIIQIDYLIKAWLASNHNTLGMSAHECFITTHVNNFTGEVPSFGFFEQIFGEIFRI